VAKINERLSKFEIEIQIPHSEELVKSGVKYVKLKVLNESGEEVMKNYYDVKDKAQEKSTYTFDKDISQVLKDNKFIINIKKKTFGFNKYLLDETIDLKHFALVNEVFQ
jgi:hypothetical protein